MKLRYSLLSSLLMIAFSGMAWGPDVLVDTTNAPSNISTVQAANGTIHMAIPDPTTGDAVAVRFYTSSDQGMTWSASSMTGSGTGVPVRTRLVSNGVEVWCAYLVDDSVHVMDMNTGVVSMYSDYAAEDFDAVMSSNGWMYLYLQVAADTDIRRAGTNDAGASWTGNTALVTGSGADPRLSISTGDTIVVNYYGPPMADEPKSIVRQGMYYESTPGTLTVSGIGFDDVITDTSIDKWQYQSVQSGGVVWMFWSEGAGSRDIKAMVSTDGGDTYGATTNVFATIVDDEFGFHAIPRTAPVTGVDIVFERYPSGALTDQVYHSVALASAPSTFTLTSEVSENAPRPFGSDLAPQALLLNDNSVGVAWVGMDLSNDVNVYWDNDLVSVGHVEERLDNDLLLFPNPTTGQLTVQVPRNAGMEQLMVLDATGALVMQTVFMSSDRYTLDVSQLPTGVYFIEVSNKDQDLVRSRFSKL